MHSLANKHDHRGRLLIYRFICSRPDEGEEEGEAEQKEDPGAEGQRKRTIELPEQRRKKISNGKKKKHSTRLGLRLMQQKLKRNEEKERKTNRE